MLENQYLKIECIKKSYADPCINEIGYDNIKPSISIPKTYFISAHAPSILKVKFKKSEKIYINCGINRTTGIDQKLSYKIKFNDLLLLNSEYSLDYLSFNVEKDLEYTFEINTNNVYGAHAIWSFYHPDESFSNIELQAIEKAKNKILNKNSNYSLFIQTCNPRKMMALRCVLSFLNSVEKLPKKILICGVDRDINSLPYPNCVDFLTGKIDIFNCLYKKGINTECLNHIFKGFKNSGNPNMWLKYVVPRLCFETDQVLVFDDDVMVMGKCEQLIESKSYLTFMEDQCAFYGQRIINYYNKKYNTNKYARIRPFVCAGIYKINKQKKQYDVEFINELILKSEDHYDEQCAVGMEAIDNDYLILNEKEYHHGGWADQNFDINKIDLIHMQGPASKYRSKKYCDIFLKRSL